MTTEKAAGRPPTQEPAPHDHPTPADQPTEGDHGQGMATTNGQPPAAVVEYLVDQPAVCPKCKRPDLNRDGDICLAKGCDWTDDEDLVDAEDLVEQLAGKLAEETASETSNGDEDLVDDDGAVRYHHPTLGDLVLEVGHWHELTVESAIDPDLVRARGYTTKGPDARDWLRSKGITAKALEPEHFPGLAIPQHRTDADAALGLQWKPAQPWSNGDGKPQKYVSQRGLANRLDVHPSRRPLLVDLTVRVWITEGIKKADSLASRGELAIGLTGVWNWRSKAGTVTDWEDVPLRDREVLIAYDADAWEKPNVLRAMIRLGAWLTSKGARVRYVIVPAEVNGTKVKGVDDFLAAGGTIAQLLDVATTKAPDAGQADDTFTDARIAERVADEVLADRYLWSPALGWLTWDGRRWSPCSDATAREAIRQWAVEQSTKILEDGKRTGRYPDRDTLAGWLSLLSRARLQAVLDLCRGIVERQADELDADPDLLNTPAAVVDLRTGEQLPHDPALLMTRITAGNYRPGYRHSDWTAALAALDELERRWFQVRTGQAVTGHPTPDGILPVLQGSGENGKSLLTTDGAVLALGDYASMASAGAAHRRRCPGGRPAGSGRAGGALSRWAHRRCLTPRRWRG
jgi:putative DNA primase/helicase